LSKDHPSASAIEALTGGTEFTNVHGVCYVIEQVYPLDHPHGPGVLGDLFQHSPSLAAEIARDPTLAAADLRRLAFLDTETTGLAGGARTFPFIVGLGQFDLEASHFRLRQYFLRDPAEEKAMLAALLDDLAGCDGLVTFNGRGFDLPLLDTRMVLTLRRRESLRQRPHLDLLQPARSLWRGRLESCSLLSLETHTLQITRTSQDVPGAWIPGMYLDYLRTGDAREMLRVIYHNSVDILSMVCLTAQLMETFGRHPARAATPAESLALARWHELEGNYDQAEAGYLRALLGNLSDRERISGLRRLSSLLKRRGRRAQAVPYWEALAQLAPEDPGPCVELAMYFEWQASDPVRAAEWALAGMTALTHWKKGWELDDARTALEHRLARLQRKVHRGPP